MNNKTVKRIIVLLAFSVGIILLLQGIWIKNFYKQKNEELKRDIYSVLASVAARLNDRDNLHSLKESLLAEEEKIKAFDKQVRVIVTSSSQSGQVYSLSESGGNHQEIRVNSSVNGAGKVITDTMVSISNNGKTVVINRRSSSKAIGKKQELDKLIDKMIMEIRTQETSSLDKINKDTLRHLIKKEMESKGVFLPFEFALKKVKEGKEKVLGQSSGFNPQEECFTYDLSLDKVFSTHLFLWFQFSGGANYILAEMQNVLLLSLFFSVLIMGVFYYTIRLILKQKKLSEVKNDFVNNMTHELKTPIATISLALDAMGNLATGGNEEKFAEYRKILKEENQKLNNHVERVLQMALLDKGELQLHKTPVNLVLLLKEVIKGYQLRIDKQKAHVEFSYLEGEIYKLGDEQHLYTVFSNLLDNALKYSGQFCRISIFCVKHEKGIIVKIKDNGIGIDVLNQERIFDKFYRAQGGNLHDVKGFGLGLSYVKSIIEAHGGKISLQSEKGNGSEFSIQFKAEL